VRTHKGAGDIDVSARACARDALLGARSNLEQVSNIPRLDRAFAQQTNNKVPSQCCLVFARETENVSVSRSGAFDSFNSRFAVGERTVAALRKALILSDPPFPISFPRRSILKGK